MTPLCDRPSPPDDDHETPHEERPREGRLARSLGGRLERLEGEATVSLVVCGFGFGVIAGYELSFFLPLNPWWWFF